MLFLIICAAIVALAVFWLKKKNQYWSSRGVVQGNPSIIFGDSLKMVFRQQSVPEMIQDWYTKIDSKARYAKLYK